MKKNLTVPLRNMGDDRGRLVPIEALRDIPFEIKRVYVVTSVPDNVARGFHAHRKLVQMVVCSSGYCDFVLDDGMCRETIQLNSMDNGLLLPPMLWHEMRNFSKDCILVVMASDHYDESDYIREYDSFLYAVKMNARLRQEEN